MEENNTVGLTDFFVIIYRFCQKHLAVILITTLLGTALGVVYTKLKPSYYKSELAGYSDVVSKEALLEIFSPLSHLIEEKNYAGFAKITGLTESESKEIKQISFITSRHIKTSNSPATSDLFMQKNLVCQVSVYNQEVYPKLEAGIKQFLNQNKYLKTTTQLEKDKLQSLLDDIIQKQNQISYKDSILTQVILSNQVDVQVNSSINNSSYIELITMKRKIQHQLNDFSLFHIVSPFYEVQKPSNKNTMIIVGLSAVFLIIGLGIAFIREISSLAIQ